MKKLILSAAIALLSVGAYAQTPLGYGIKAGVNLPQYHFDNSAETKSSTNFHVTAYLDAPVTTNFYIQPGVSLQGKGAKLYDGDALQITQNTMWLEVPVNAVAKFPTGYASNFFVGAGPYAAFGLSGKNDYKSDYGSAESKFEFGSDKSQKGFDAGINFLAGYQLENGLTLGAGYGLGLTDIAPDNANVKQNNRVLSFSVGFAL